MKTRDQNLGDYLKKSHYVPKTELDSLSDEDMIESKNCLHLRRLTNETSSD